MKNELSGNVRLIAVHADGRSEQLQSIEATLDGFPGERYSGTVRKLKRSTGGLLAGTEVRNTRQLSLVSVEELHDTAAELGISAIDPLDLKANLVVAGIPALTLLPPGTRLQFSGGLRLVVEGLNAPCTSSGGRIASRFPDHSGLAASFVKAARYRRGIVAWVEKAGMVRAEDQVQVLLPAQPPYPFLQA